jgi:hypothetical protein
MRNCLIIVLLSRCPGVVLSLFMIIAGPRALDYP